MSTLLFCITARAPFAPVGRKIVVDNTGGGIAGRGYRSRTDFTYVKQFDRTLFPTALTPDFGTFYAQITDCIIRGNQAFTIHMSSDPLKLLLNQCDCDRSNQNSWTIYIRAHDKQWRPLSTSKFSRA